MFISAVDNAFRDKSSMDNLKAKKNTFIISFRKVFLTLKEWGYFTKQKGCGEGHYGPTNLS